MKLLIATCLTIAAFSFIGTPTAKASTEGSQASDREYEVTSIIDDVAVPLDVLMYAQTMYLGHAVTQVQEVRHGADQAYRLRVDRDDIPDDYDSIHLFYDKEWKLLDEREIQAPPPKIEYVEPEPEDDEEEEKEKERKTPEPEKPENTSADDDKDKDKVINPRKDEDETSNETTSEENN